LPVKESASRSRKRRTIAVGAVTLPSVTEEPAMVSELGHVEELLHLGRWPTTLLGGWMASSRPLHGELHVVEPAS